MLVRREPQSRILLTTTTAINLADQLRTDLNRFDPALPTAVGLGEPGVCVLGIDAEANSPGLLNAEKAMARLRMSTSSRSRMFSLRSSASFRRSSPVSPHPSWAEPPWCGPNSPRISRHHHCRSRRRCECVI
jgi:hypothetical protein